MVTRQISSKSKLPSSPFWLSVQYFSHFFYFTEKLRLEIWEYHKLNIGPEGSSPNPRKLL